MDAGLAVSVAGKPSLYPYLFDEEAAASARNV
jgi:hypothetical protein